MASLLCATVTAPTTAELRRRRDEASDADLVELRLDTVADPDVAGALAGRSVPVIVTCRPRWEGGHFGGSEEERERILAEALALGAEWVDVEWRAGFGDLLQHTGGRRIVLSTHDFDAVPRDLAERIRVMQATGAEVVKASAKVHRLADCLVLLETGRGASKRGSVIVLGMGERGAVTRILPERFGSVWSYAGLLDDIGQFTMSRLIDEFRFREIGAAAALYGLAGSPIGHSVSPAMHNAALRATGRDAVYLPLDAADPDDFIAFAEGLGLAGASVTIPFKRVLADRVDDCDATARRIGAINTLKRENGRWIACNTDANGFLGPLQGRVRLDRCRVSILGAGGAARAAATALASSGADVTIHARRRPAADELARAVGAHAGPWPLSPGTWDVLVNCTPVGMYPNANDTPVPATALDGRLVYDMVYNPAQTRLLRDAAAAGCDTIAGLDMLVAQAEEQFRWWFDAIPPAGVMRTAAERRLAAFAGVPEQEWSRNRPGSLR